MKKKKKKVNSKETGLDIGIILSKYLFHTDHLHYGYWTKDINVEISNLSIAQEKYVDFVFSHIPENIKSILDVGAGIGVIAERLINKGFIVDCVSPSPFLTKYARKRLSDKSCIYESTYEDLQINKHYDLILFCESFQYINMQKALENTSTHLTKNGYLLICDFFKTEAPGKSTLGGGHKISKFRNTISNFPFEIVKDIDITDNTAPNIAIVDDLLSNVGIPIKNLCIDYFHSNYPLLVKLISWKFKKKFAKIDNKYFSRKKNAYNFKKYKTYRFMLYQKKENKKYNIEKM